MIIMNISQGGSGKVAVSNDHHEVIRKEKVEKLP